MSFDALEISQEDGNPIQLFAFTFGPVVTRFTNYSSDIVFGGVSWATTQISKDEQSTSIESAGQDLKLKMPLDNPIASQYISNVPGRVGNVRVFRGHADDPLEETILEFDGYIAQVSFDGALEATVTCKPITNAYNKSGPRFNYQSACNHVHYDGGCKILRSSFQHVGLVNAISGRDITVAGLGAKGAGWAVGGFVVSPAGGDDDSRAILAQTGDTISLLNVFAGDVLGTQVDVFAGCDHSVTTCESKFANVLNFGGFAFVPTKNPFNSSLRGGD